MPTNVPGLTFGPDGFAAPAESAILTGEIADINAAFGGGVNPSLSTPQGQLASSFTAIVGDKNDAFLFMQNMVDPAFSSGRWQDGLGRIYFLTRDPAQSTLVQATCGGLPTTPIPLGALAQNKSDGNIYQSVAAGVIGADGTVVIPFACVLTGPIACGVGALDTIYQAIGGWDTITNLSEGVVGNVVESRADFEFRREQSVQKNAVGTMGAITGAVFDVPGVTDVYPYNNASGSPVTVQGVTIAANSIYVCVNGGVDTAVGEAILTKKAPGCGMTGNHTVTVYDSNPLYSAPIPYSITFELPTSQPIVFLVTLKSNAGVPSNVGALVDTAIINAFGGADGGSRARIGDTIFASRYYAPIAALGPWAEIISIEVGSADNASAKFTASIATTNMTVSAVATGTLAVGQTVVAPGVLDGTTIISQTSGTAGGTGVYVISQTQTVASRAMASVVANLNSTAMQINEAPTVSAPNITLVLA